MRSTDPWADLDAGAYRQAARRTPARRPPGGRFRYSSLGFGLLGDALAARAGASYEELLQDRICSPLGLLDTAISVPPEKQPRLLAGRSRRGHPRPPLRDAMPAAGAIRASAHDLLRFLPARWRLRTARRDRRFALPPSRARGSADASPSASAG